MRDENWRADDATGCAWRQDETTVTVKVAPVRSLAMDRAERWDARGALGATRAGARARVLRLARAQRARGSGGAIGGASRAMGETTPTRLAASVVSSGSRERARTTARVGRGQG